MKLATLKDGSRDGTLALVSRDLARAIAIPEIAPTLQAALDEWGVVAPHLEKLYAQLIEGKAPGAVAFDPRQAHSPLPRAYQWADGSAYVNHVELVRRSRGATMPAEFWTDPLMYQGGSDGFLAPTDDIVFPDETWGIDFEAEVAVITGDVPMGVTPHAAKSQVLLLMLVNDVSLRNLIPAELAKNFGFFQSKPASSFSPVAVTPDEIARLPNLADRTQKLRDAIGPRLMLLVIDDAWDSEAAEALRCGGPRCGHREAVHHRAEG